MKRLRFSLKITRFHAEDKGRSEQSPSSPGANAPGFFSYPVLKSPMDKINRAAPECSLYGFLATEAPVGVILRRGPSKYVQMIQWNTDTDAFECGQWLHGRVYEYQSDLSPDGKAFIYLAAQYDSRHGADKKIGCYYGVICKPPYFTALAVWNAWKSVTPGYFLSNTQVSYSASPFIEVPSFKPGKGNFPAEWQFIKTQYSSYQPAQTRLSERYGWVLTDSPAVYEKEIGHTPWHLQRKQTGTKFGYSIRIGSQIRSIVGADWVDIDQRGRLVFTRDGKVFACQDMTDGLDNAIELADFNSSTFEPVEAPEWATAW